MENKENRLKLCMDMRKITVAALAADTGMTPQYITMLRTGRRPMSYRTAQNIGRALDVSSAYLMGLTDIMAPGGEWIEPECESSGGALLLKLMRSTGCSIRFQVIRPYIDRHEELAVALEDLEGFSLNNPCCSCHFGGELAEVVVVAVLIDGERLEFPAFSLMAGLAIDQVKHSIEDMKNVSRGFNRYMDMTANLYSITSDHFPDDVAGTTLKILTAEKNKKLPEQ